MEVVEHVVRQLFQSEFASEPNGLFVRFAHTEVIECNSQRLDANRAQLTQEHLVLTENSRIDALVEVNSSEYWKTSPSQLRARYKAEVADFGNDITEPR